MSQSQSLKHVISVFFLKVLFPGFEKPWWWNLGKILLKNQRAP